MIILGDIASPDSNYSSLISDFLKSLKLSHDQSILFNLEGLIQDNHSLTDTKPVLFNHSSVLEAFEPFQTKIAALANNHTLDLPDCLTSTKKLLSQKRFISVGAGDQSDVDFEEVSFRESGYEITIINACWDFLLYHQNNYNDKIKVNTIDENKISERVKKIKQLNPESKIITYFHWSFDLEILPSPSYRLFAKDLIDQGASLVVGCHSHCIQGGEKYKNGYIIYGLGNFYIPSAVYANKNLIFPPMSDLGWLLDWDIDSNKIKNYWIKTESNQLALLSSDEFEESAIRRKYTIFDGMSDQAYLHFFKSNRRKKVLIPVFSTYGKSIENSLKMNFLRFRAKSARLLAKLGVIKWQN